MPSNRFEGHTPGALRAAKRLLDRADLSEASADTWAYIIDDETAAPDLLRERDEAVALLDKLANLSPDADPIVWLALTEKARAFLARIDGGQGNE